MTHIPEDVMNKARELCISFDVDNKHGFEETLVATAIMKAVKDEEYAALKGGEK